MTSTQLIFIISIFYKFLPPAMVEASPMIGNGLIQAGTQLSSAAGQRNFGH